MDIDPRITEIDECLYRVAVKAVVMDGDKVLLVQELPEMWWGLPGGGVDHGETIEEALPREIEEELAVPAEQVISDYEIIYHEIGIVIDNIPRLTLYYRTTLPKGPLKATNEIAKFDWFGKKEFMELTMSPAYKNRETIAEVIFGN